MKKIKLFLLLLINLIFFVACNATDVTHQNETENVTKESITTEFIKEDITENIFNENMEETESEELSFIKSEAVLEMQTESLSSDEIHDMEENIKPFVESDVVIAEYRYPSMMAPNTQDMTKEHFFVFKQYSCDSEDVYDFYVTWDEFDYQGLYIRSGSTKGIIESRDVFFDSYWTLDVNGDGNYDLMLKVQDMGNGTVDDKTQEVVLVFLNVPGGMEYAGCYRADSIDDNELFIKQLFNGLE